MKKFFKVILTIFILSVFILSVNLCYYTFVGQHKSVEKLSNNTELNLYECCSIYQMHATMCEIMPTYNQLYESTLIKYDVFNNVDVTTTFDKSGKENSKNTGSINTTDSGTQTNNGKSTGNVKGTTKSDSKNNITEWNLHSDTPQGGITGVENEQYLSDATKRTNNSNADSTVTNSENNRTEINNTLKTTNTQTNSNTNKGTKETSEEWTQRIFGKNNGQSNNMLLKEFRDNILNIDQMIIKDLEPLFFQLW